MKFAYARWSRFYCSKQYNHVKHATNNRSNHYEYRFELNSRSTMSESQRFENEGKKSHYDQFERSFSKGSLFFNQQIFSPSSNICNVDNNGGVCIQPSSFNGYYSIDNMDQPYTCNQTSEALSESSIFSNYNSIYNGARIYPYIESGTNFDQDSSLMKHQRAQFSENHYKANECRNVFYQSSHLITHKNIHIGENNYKFSERGKVFNQSSRVTQHPSIHVGEERYKCNTCGKVFNY